MKSLKYSRTPHFPWSPSPTSDDKVLSSVNHFFNKEVVVSEKLDGECTGMTNELCHARSLDSKDHPSRHWVKQLHASIKSEIPDGWKIFGENLYAKHSIHYANLPTYFFVFGIYTDKNICLSWDDTKEWCSLMNLCTVPELYRGIWNEDHIKSLWKGTSVFGGTGEGYVVRVAESFHYDQFWGSVAKWVREDHVQTSEHWMEQAVVKNLLDSTLQSEN